MLNSKKLVLAAFGIPTLWAQCSVYQTYNTLFHNNFLFKTVTYDFLNSARSSTWITPRVLRVINMVL